MLSGDFHPAALLTVTRVIEKGNSEITVLHILGLLEECLANMKAIVSYIIVILSVWRSESIIVQALVG